MSSENEETPATQEELLPRNDTPNLSKNLNQRSENSLISENQSDVAPIHLLDDSVLEKIFNFVPFIEREKKTIVCKRWKRMIRKMWQKEREFDTINGTPFEISRKIRNGKSRDLLKKKIFKRCGLKKILIQANKFAGCNNVVADIVSKCPKIEELTFYQLNMKEYKLNLLAHLENLKKLVLHDCDPITDSNLRFALRDNRTLTHLEITNCKNLTGRFLRRLQAPLETLILCCQENLFSYNLEKNKTLQSTLKHLNLSSVQYFYQPDLSDLLECFPDLRSLTLAKYDADSDNYNCMCEIPDLKQLLSLNVSFNMNVNSEFLEDIIKKCHQLELLDISGTDVHAKIIEENSSVRISDLNTLQDLRSLNLSYLQEMNCDEITNYASKSPSIEYLYLAGLSNLEDEHIKSLLTSCLQLKYLDLSRCPKVTGKIFATAVQVVESRVNNLPLHLAVGGTKIQNRSSQNAGSTSKIKNHPLLSVTYNDNYELLKSRYIYGAKNFSIAKEDDIVTRQTKKIRSSFKKYLRSIHETKNKSNDSANNDSQDGGSSASNDDNKEDGNGDKSDKNDGSSSEDEASDEDTGMSRDPCNIS